MSQQNRPPQRNHPQQGQRPPQQQGYPQQGQQQPYQPAQQGYPQQGQGPPQQQGYKQDIPMPPQQANYQQGQYPPQGRPMPPQAPQPHYNQPLPAQQQTQPEKIYVEKKTNPVMMVLKVIAYPFIKFAQLIGNVLSIILQELVRSVVSFILGITLLIVFVALIGGYGYALYLTEFDFAAAVPEMLRLFASFFGFGGS